MLPSCNILSALRPYVLMQCVLCLCKTSRRHSTPSPTNLVNRNMRRRGTCGGERLGILLVVLMLLLAMCLSRYGVMGRVWFKGGEKNLTAVGEDEYLKFVPNATANMWK